LYYGFVERVNETSSRPNDARRHGIERSSGRRWCAAV